MNWTLNILLSAVLLALYDLAKKSSVRENAVLPVLLISSGCGFLAYAAVLYGAGCLAATLDASATVISLAAAKSLIVATSWVFTFTALRTLPVSLATPIRAGAPAIVFVFAFLLFQEIPTPLQAFGMALVFTGYFAFSWAGRHEGIDFRRNRAVWCAFAGAGLSAASALFDKYVFQCAAAPVAATQLYFQGFLVIDYALLLTLRHFARPRRTAFEWRWTIPLVGICLTGADRLYFQALAEPGVPISVASLLRRVSVVLTFVLGARIFRETNLRRKILALALVLLGVALLVAQEIP